MVSQLNGGEHVDTTLIIIRGNSGSGKTTLAKTLQTQLGHNTLLVSQDVVRRTMLMSDDHPGNLSIDLIRQIALYGNGRVPVVIVEGILARNRYGDMLRELMGTFPRTLVYYFDVDFTTTLARHRTRQRDFGPEEMRRWWLDNDQLGVPAERLITSRVSLAEAVRLVQRDLQAR